MQNYLFALLTKFRIWKEAKVNKQPLSRENAYVLSSINKKNGHYTDITKEYQDTVLTSIESAAKYGDTYLLIKHPVFATPMDKEAIVDFIAKLGYSVCYINSDVMLISWKYSPNDFSVALSQ